MADAAVVVDLLGTVEDAMTRPVVRLTEDMIASEAARILERAGASSAPVTTHDGERVVGFITMKDLTARADIHTAAQTGPFHRFEHLLAGVEVGDVMTRDAVVAPADWPLM